MDVAYIVGKLKEILPIANTNLYDEQLTILTNASMSKLETEGVPNAFEDDTPEGFDYVLCVAYQVAMDMDFDIDRNRLYEQYITRVNTLRCKVANQKLG